MDKMMSDISNAFGKIVLYVFPECNCSPEKTRGDRARHA